MKKYSMWILIAVCAVGGWIFVTVAGYLFTKNHYLSTPDGRETSYYKKMGGIHLRTSDNVFSLIASPVSGAHYRTFEPIDYNFARDKRYVYYRFDKQPHVDRDSFTITIRTETVDGEEREVRTYRDKYREYKTQSHRLVPID